MAIVSSEDVAGADGGTAGWRRQLSGDFDISVDDSASISGVVNNIDANETVQGGPGDPGADSHELGITGHWEATAGTGFSGVAEVPGATTGDVYHERDATRDQVRALARSAAYAVNAAAVLLGQAAERFWRNGKCVELIVDPAGGDVDPDSVTDVVAKLKHRFEGNELDKPVEASLTGVKAVDPLNQKQPAPATVKFTAGPNEGDVGEIAFKSVSKRGIAEKSVKFTVRKPAWDVTFDGTDVETFGPVVKNTFDATLVGLKIEARDSALTGKGKLRLNGTVTSGACSGPPRRDGDEQGDRDAGRDRSGGDAPHHDHIHHASERLRRDALPGAQSEDRWPGPRRAVRGGPDGVRSAGGRRHGQGLQVGQHRRGHARHGEGHLQGDPGPALR